MFLDIRESFREDDRADLERRETEGNKVRPIPSAPEIGSGLGNSPDSRSLQLCDPVAGMNVSAAGLSEQRNVRQLGPLERTSVRVQFAALIARHDLHLCAWQTMNQANVSETSIPAKDRLPPTKAFAHLGKVAGSRDLDVPVRLDEVCRGGRTSSVADTNAMCSRRND